MPDQPPQITTDNVTNKQDPSPIVSTHAPLSDHAEDILAESVGHELDLDNDADNTPPKTVKEVLTEMVDNREELSITLEFGAGESGIDQASWEIEVITLQRAFVRKQKTAELNILAQSIKTDTRAVFGKLDQNWIAQTTELKSGLQIFEKAAVTRQEIDDFHHRIFAGGTYLEYLEGVLNGTDDNGLLDAARNLSTHVKQVEVQRAELVNPANVDFDQLTDAIIAVRGDIDKLSIELERDMPSAVLRRNLGNASHLAAIINIEFLKDYKLWAHSFNLNIREVLATERSATNGPISDKYRDQLKEMLLAGEKQISAILELDRL